MSPARILVVEDEMVVALDLQSRLELAGYSVPATAMTACEAVKLAEEVHPDLILMDVGLRGPQDGIEAAEQIQAKFQIPIIFLTAYADDNSRQRIEAIRPAGFLTKPFEERRLLKAVEAALRGVS